MQKIAPAISIIGMTKDVIREISINQKEYPQLLKQIHDPPEILYVRGNINVLDTQALAVVGTRKISEYGKLATPHIVSDLSASGLTIISGMAHGVDTLAHKAALDAGGLTVAVLGTGIDDVTIYPADNLGLAHRIIRSGGAIISEYPPGTHGTPFSFPKRNRIISGMSCGVVVIEADEKSGSLITARCALDQNRDVFAVPGSIFSKSSRGTNEIIKKGAKLISLAEDILEEYDIQISAKGGSASGGKAGDEIEEKILAVLSEADGQITADEIIRQSGVEAQTVNAKLVIMEINKTIKKIGDKYVSV